VCLITERGGAYITVGRRGEAFTTRSNGPRTGRGEKIELDRMNHEGGDNRSLNHKKHFAIKNADVGKKDQPRNSGEIPYAGQNKSRNRNGAFAQNIGIEDG